MKKLILILLLIPTLSSAEMSEPQLTSTGIVLTCNTIVPVPSKVTLGCDPVTGSVSTVSPIGVVSGSSAPTPIAISNGPDVTVGTTEQILLALPAITPLIGRGVTVHMYVGYAMMVSAHFTTFRLMRNGIEILKTAHRCGGGIGESCHYSASVIDTGAVAGTPTTYELRWVASAGTSRSNSASNFYERRQLAAIP